MGFEVQMMRVREDGRIAMRPVDFVEAHLGPRGRAFPMLQEGEEIQWEMGSNIPIIIKIGASHANLD